MYCKNFLIAFQSYVFVKRLNPFTFIFILYKTTKLPRTSEAPLPRTKLFLLFVENCYNYLSF